MPYLHISGHVFLIEDKGEQAPHAELLGGDEDSSLQQHQHLYTNSHHLHRDTQGKA